MARFNVKLWNDTGIPDALRKYCNDHNMTAAQFVNMAVDEKLSNMDVHSITISEIEEVEQEYNAE